ncbi:hypothetical protein J4479_02820 [Candidatus Woesearchaeota archaeon]|nr:hypothetical protein [Candidatus Woesearchaeota archaeon]
MAKIETGMDLNRLEAAIRNSWCKETSSTPEWSPQNPARGQCAVTACVFQDYVGGEVVWFKAKLPDNTEESHYFNRVNGTEYDLTRLQFPVGTVLGQGAERMPGITTRGHALSHEPTRERYETLRYRVARLLEED